MSYVNEVLKMIQIGLIVFCVVVVLGILASLAVKLWPDRRWRK